MIRPEVLEGIECKVCGNKSADKFSAAFEKDGLTVVQCQVCSFVFLPYYFRKDITYLNYKDEKVLEQVRKGNDWLKLQRHFLRYKLLKKYQKDGKLFDLGVGWGHFLEAGRILGYDVSGIEISEMPYRYAKEDLKLPVEKIDFFDMQIQEGYYDMVTMWDVLEHIDECKKIVVKCCSMLKKGGYIVIQVPQIDSFIAKNQKANWKMMGLDHVNYFSKKTMTKILEENGFKVRRIKSSIELKLLLMYTILPWVKKMKGGKDKTAKISSAERQEYFNKTTNRPKWVLKIMMVIHDIIYDTLSALNIGEEMIVIAQKV
jgi:2-polyprenyl-3-methyl-5-hydroxy-6-metoxy-1,4-benzoquinol methylase